MISTAVPCRVDSSRGERVKPQTEENQKPHDGHSWQFDCLSPFCILHPFYMPTLTCFLMQNPVHAKLHRLMQRTTFAGIAICILTPPQHAFSSHRLALLPHPSRVSKGRFQPPTVFLPPLDIFHRAEITTLLVTQKSLEAVSFGFKKQFQKGRSKVQAQNYQQNSYLCKQT